MIIYCFVIVISQVYPAPPMAEAVVKCNLMTLFEYVPDALMPYVPAPGFIVILLTPPIALSIMPSTVVLELSKLVMLIL